MLSLPDETYYYSHNNTHNTCYCCSFHHRKVNCTRYSSRSCSCDSSYDSRFFVYSFQGFGILYNWRICEAIHEGGLGERSKPQLVIFPERKRRLSGAGVSRATQKSRERTFFFLISFIFSFTIFNSNFSSFFNIVFLVIQ